MFVIRQTTYNKASSLKHMKKIVLILTLITALASCSRNTANDSHISPQEKKDYVEVIYFHGKQRCLSCRAIEKFSRETVDSAFQDELNNGTVVYKVVDITTPEGEALADRYEVAGSSLFISKRKDGKETKCDMTESGFKNARKHTDIFKREVADRIHEYLKQL